MDEFDHGRGRDGWRSVRAFTISGRIAWGYALIYLNININALDLLPDWAGWLLIGSGPARRRRVGEPSVLLLRPLCWLLAAWEGLCWALEAMGRPTELWGLWLIAAAVSLYVHFQLFTNLAGAAERFACPQRRSLLVLRTVNVVFTTLMHLPLPLDSGDAWAGLAPRSRVPRHHRRHAGGDEHLSGQPRGWGRGTGVVPRRLRRCPPRMYIDLGAQRRGKM